MFWVALATAIMMLSGEGDDSRAILALLAGLRQAITQHVPAEDRRSRALLAVTAFEQTFAHHRFELQAFGKCVEAADRKYQATRADYDACAARIAAQRAQMRVKLAALRRDYEAAVLPAERTEVIQAVSASSQAWVLDPALVAAQNQPPPVPSRFRGLEGVAARRHLTLPRNVVSVMYGPLSTSTLGQRFPSPAVLDAGTSYLHQRVQTDSSSTLLADQWHTRLGVLFGLFDDLEAGALFLPFELAPEFKFDPVLVFLTQQFRFDDLDLAMRFSFTTPGGEGGWSIAPGALLGTRGRWLAFKAGVFGAMELGALTNPQSPAASFNAPLRATINLLPTVFLTADTGVASDDLSSAHRFAIPLGFGAGYSWLVGKRLVDMTASFTWDRLLMPNAPEGISTLQPKVFRIAAGASMTFQAM
ncbi:MAG TPA: hypothetical protein VIW29_01725 [Polyangiaceae bacterium]